MQRIIISAALALAATFLSTMAHGQDDVPYYPTVPLMLPAGDPYGQSFVRLLWVPPAPASMTAEVRITAVDDGGTVYDPINISLPAGRSFHFNSDDLTYGNASKGIDAIGAARQGNWRLHIDASGLDDDNGSRLRVAPYIRTRDGFLTHVGNHDTDTCTPGTAGTDNCEFRRYVGTFNPASNTTQQSRLRVINRGPSSAALEIHGYDDTGTQHGPVHCCPINSTRT